MIGFTDQEMEGTFVWADETVARIILVLISLIGLIGLDLPIRRFDRGDVCLDQRNDRKYKWVLIALIGLDLPIRRLRGRLVGPTERS